MKLFLSEESELEKYRKEITRIGNTVNHPDLFEDIYNACKNKRAFLFESNEGIGFTVLCPTRAPGVLLWASQSFGSLDWSCYMNDVTHLGKEIGAQELEIWSVRKGMFRKLPALGFTSEPSTWNDVPITIWKKKI